MSSTRIRTAVLAVAAASVLAPSAAFAEPTPLGGELLRTGTGFNFWSLDAACHFGPIQQGSLDDTRMDVHGVAVAPGATATTVRCTVEHGNGTWTNVYEARTAGGVTVTTGTAQLWWASYDRICVSASAEYTFMDWMVAPTRCQDA